MIQARIHWQTVLLSMLLTLTVAGCSTNPVTGKNEVVLVGESWEREVGAKYYAPMRQAQGGDYAVDPKVTQYVQKVGKKLAAVSDRKLPYEFHVINDSTPNAWALPSGKIAINRGLLTELKSESELAAVLGHEIVHAAARHGALAQTRGLGLQIVSLGAAIGLGGKIGGQNAQMLSGLGAQLVNQSYSRKAERESDLYGMRYMSKAGYDPQGAVDLQKTFVELSKARGATGSKWEHLLSSHPPSPTRVSANAETARALPKGGVKGVNEYKRAMASLNKSKPAYEAFDQAIAAFKKGNRKSAQSLVQKAIRIEPREAQFYSALGDLALDKNNLSSARNYYDKSIKLNNNFYYFYLRRGEVHKRNKQYDAAKRDLTRSYQLLPTADAQELLGDVSHLTRDYSGARKAWQAAAKAGGTAGQSAYSKLVKMDIGANPDQFFAIKSGLSSKGTLAYRLTNTTPVAVTGINYAVVDKRTRRAQRNSVRGVVGAGKSVVIDTGLKMSKQMTANFVLDITSATVAN